MHPLKPIYFLPLFLISINIAAQEQDPFQPDNTSPKPILGMTLVWNDEFNAHGKPDSAFWNYEKGFVRNQELQWYQADNAFCEGGVLVIEGRKQQLKNPGYIAGHGDWKKNREFAEYTSSSIKTQGKKQWQFGRFEIRARIDTSEGSWPAIWTLGVSGQWPSNGEIDLMEFYRINNVPNILANVAWGTDKKWTAKWDSEKTPYSVFSAMDTLWHKKFHVWRMDWTKDSICLFLDDKLLNTTLLQNTVNSDGSNPFLQPHYLLLNLALGGNGGNPGNSRFPIKYEVDYVRIYQFQ